MQRIYNPFTFSVNLTPTSDVSIRKTSGTMITPITTVKAPIAATSAASSTIFPKRATPLAAATPATAAAAAVLPIQTIELWVFTYIKHNSIPIETTSSLKSIGELSYPSELNGSVKIQTSGNENDCMVHSILTQLSRTFRMLSAKNRNTVASAFRREELIKIPRINVGLLKSTRFLTDTELELFANHYRIGTLIISDARGAFPQSIRAFYVEYTGNNAMVFHYNGVNHYSAIFLPNNNSITNDRFTLINDIFSNLYLNYNLSAVPEPENIRGPERLGELKEQLKTIIDAKIQPMFNTTILTNRFKHYIQTHASDIPSASQLLTYISNTPNIGQNIFTHRDEIINLFSIITSVNPSLSVFEEFISNFERILSSSAVTGGAGRSSAAGGAGGPPPSATSPAAAAAAAVTPSPPPPAAVTPLPPPAVTSHLKPPPRVPSPPVPPRPPPAAAAAAAATSVPVAASAAAAAAAVAAARTEAARVEASAAATSVPAAAAAAASEFVMTPVITSPTSDADKLYANDMLSRIPGKILDKIIHVLTSDNISGIIKVPFFSQYDNVQSYDYSSIIPGKIEAFKLHDQDLYVIHQTIEMVTDGRYTFPYVLFRPHAFYIQDDLKEFTFYGTLSIYNYRTGQSINQQIEVHYHDERFSPIDNPIQLDASGLDLQDGINRYFVKFIPDETRSENTIYPVETKRPDRFEGIFLIEKHKRSINMTPGVVENSATYSLAAKGGRRQTRSKRINPRKRTLKR